MKYYARIGRRFVQVKSAKGMFYNNDGTFSEMNTDKSIGICVHDDFEETIIASLSISKDEVPHDIAEFICDTIFPFGEGHIPTSYELLMLKNIKLFKFNHNSFWVSDDYNNPFCDNCLYISNNGFNISRCSTNSSRHKIIPFLTIKK